MPRRILFTISGRGELLRDYFNSKRNSFNHRALTIQEFRPSRQITTVTHAINWQISYHSSADPLTVFITWRPHFLLYRPINLSRRPPYTEDRLEVHLQRWASETHTHTASFSQRPKKETLSRIIKHLPRCHQRDTRVCKTFVLTVKKSRSLTTISTTHPSSLEVRKMNAEHQYEEECQELEEEEEQLVDVYNRQTRRIQGGHVWYELFKG